MDQRTPIQEFDQVELEARPRRTAVKRFILAIGAAGLLVAGLALGYRTGRTTDSLPDWVPRRVALALGAQPSDRHEPTGPIIYYRDPDGKPLYSAGPKKTLDGRDYVPVRASEDVSFDDAPQSTTSPGAAGGKRILYYRNPMGLPDTSPVPKKDSMGMDYIPVYEGEADDGVTVTISPGKLQRTGVRSETVSRRVLIKPVRAPGTIKLDERRVAVISPRSDSFIERVENVTTGDRVRKGQRLFELYSPEINAAAAQLVSNPGFEGSRRRLENLAVPAEVIAEMERTRRVPLAITWTAPRDGIVLERNAIEGMKASSGQVLFRLADISKLWVLADVPEREIGMIRPGQGVTIRVRSLPGRSFSGRIELIYPQVNVETRTARVRIEIDNPEGLLLPDMYADVEIATAPSDPVLAVPDSAVIDSGTRQIVILDRGDGRFEPREVRIGVRGEGFTEIQDGIAEGDQVVVAANFLIDAESNLKAALRAMTTPENPP